MKPQASSRDEDYRGLVSFIQVVLPRNTLRRVTSVEFPFNVEQEVTSHCMLRFRSFVFPHIQINLPNNLFPYGQDPVLNLQSTHQQLSL